MNATISSAREPASPTAVSAPADLPFRVYRPRPAHPDWAALSAEAQTLADRIRGVAERPRPRHLDRRRQLRAFRTTAHNYLDNRRIARDGREDLRPLYFIWTVLRTCNFACTYCDDHQGRKYPDLPNEGVLDTAQGIRLLEIMRTRTPSVYFAGGEPTARRDLPELTRAARDLDYYPIIINTNGSLLSDRLLTERWRTWLADTDIIIVSLDTLDVESARAMWAYRRPQEVYRNLLVLDALKREFRFKLMVNTVIQPGHVDEAEAVLDFANDLGIWYCPVPMNVGPTINPALHDDPAYARLVDKILARKRAGYPIIGSLRMNERLLRSAPLTCRNAVKPHVDFDGRLAWPCKATVNVKPEMINVLDFPDVDTLYTEACRLVDPTRFHGPARNQCGASCNWAQNYSTDAYVQGLLHPASMLADVREFLRR